MDYKKLYEEIYDPSESVCWNCKKFVQCEQTSDSPEEVGCMGIEANLLTIGGCKEYE